MLFFGKQQKRVRKLIRQGELNQACRVVRQADLADAPWGRRIANQLIDRLIQRADRFSAEGKLSAAWRDLQDASAVARKEQADRVSREASRLVDRTIDCARALLFSGRPADAQSAIDLLRHRKILDRRADEVQGICRRIAESDQLAAQGHMKRATELLTEVKSEQPGLDFLDSRIRTLSHHQDKLQELTGQLRLAINQSHWQGAREVSNQILEIAPENQVARDAWKRSELKQTGGLMLLQDSQAQRSTHHEQSTSPGYRRSDAQPEGRKVPVSPSTREIHSEDQNTNGLRNFLLWIDGVGGYLVCPGDEVTIGRAVPEGRIDIPVQADIRRHHARIRRMDNQYLFDDLNASSGQSDSPAASRLLKDGQGLDLGSGVRIRFSAASPLGRSARLDFISRHRTEPWCDAVILMGDAILMGPDGSCHIACPDWPERVVVFRRGSEVWLRAADPLSVDGDPVEGPVALRDGRRVVGAGFSISCEEVRPCQSH